MNTLFFRVQHDVVHLPQNGQSRGLGEGSGLQTVGPSLLPHSISQCRQRTTTRPNKPQFEPQLLCGSTDDKASIFSSNNHGRPSTDDDKANNPRFEPPRTFFNR